jgi:hypothetical protein
MVGRMSKRNKRLKTNSDRAPTATTAPSTNNAMVAMVTDPLSPQSPESPFQNLSTFPLPEYDDFGNDAFLSNFDLSSFSTNEATSRSTTSEINSQQMNIDFDIDQFTMPSPDMNEITPVVAEITPPGYESNPGSLSKGNEDQHLGFLEEEEDKVKRHFPHVHALSRVIKFLEAYAANKAIAIDEVMRINQACMADITKIMGLEEYKLCQSCPMLISTAMELMLLLYENGISPEARNTQSTCPSSPQRLAGDLPSLQFGVFQLDPEERIAFSNRIICKELQRYSQVIRTLGAERQGQAGDRSSFRRVHARWMVELENRVDSLVTMLRI